MRSKADETFVIVETLICPLQICHSCFEITARTVLAQFGHFALRTRIRFQKGGRPPNSPGCALRVNNHPVESGFIRSGKIRGKHIFFEMVRESQGKSGKVREFNEKVRENLEKVREIFLESSYLL